MAAQSRSELPRMSVEEFLAFEAAHPEGKYEYIDGYVRDLRALLLAGGTNTHSLVSMNIGAELVMALRGRSCRVYSPDVKVRINARRYLHPDVTVSCDARDAAREEGIEYPIIVVEVLSPSTEAFDRGNKLALYMSCPSVQEYLLVDTRQPRVEVFQRQEGPALLYHAYGAGESLELVSLGISIPLDAIYQNVHFEQQDDDAL